MTSKKVWFWVMCCWGLFLGAMQNPLVEAQERIADLGPMRNPLLFELRVQERIILADLIARNGEHQHKKRGIQAQRLAVRNASQQQKQRDNALRKRPKQPRNTYHNPRSRGKK